MYLRVAVPCPKVCCLLQRCPCGVLWRCCRLFGACVEITSCVARFLACGRSGEGLRGGVRVSGAEREGFGELGRC